MYKFIIGGIFPFLNFGFLSFQFLPSFVQFKAELGFADTLAKVKRGRHSSVYSLLSSSSSTPSSSSPSPSSASSLLPSSGVNPAVATTFNSIIERGRRRGGGGTEYSVRKYKQLLLLPESTVVQCRVF